MSGVVEEGGAPPSALIRLRKGAFAIGIVPPTFSRLSTQIGRTTSRQNSNMSSGLWTLSSVHSKGCITGLRLLVALGNFGISKRRSRVGSCSGTLVVLVNKGVNFSTANLRTLNLLSVTSCHCLCLQVINGRLDD